MAQSPVLVTVEYSSPGTQPPVFVAGSFSGWEPQEMQYTTNADNELVFHKEVTVEKGKEYQYKFRLGPGDWWVLNEDAPTSTDNIGNRNNVLSAPGGKESEPTPTTPQDTIATGPEHAASKTDLESAEAPRTDENSQTALRRDSRTPELAAVAAEVADSAAVVDQEEPEPDISDKEAGQIGLRRLSNTPIPEVAKTAAEVADVAEIIDKNHTNFDLPSTPSEEELLNGTTNSGTITPWEDRAPLFAHECMGADAAQYPQVRYPLEPLTPETSNEEAVAEEEVDFNDPTLEHFPHDRTSILERFRTLESRLNEDETKFEGTPISPVVSPLSPMNGANRSPDHRELPSISPALLATEHRSPSLGSIAEEHSEENNEELTHLPSDAQPINNHGEPDLMHLNQDEKQIPSGKQASEPSVDVQEVLGSLPDSPSPGEPASDSSPQPEQADSSLHNESDNIPSDREDDTREASIGNEGPRIMVHPATPNSIEAAFRKPADEAKSTAVEKENEASGSQLVSRKQQPSPTERSVTPNSLSSEHAAKSQNILKAFWRVVFVEWLGGLITKLCGGRRHTLLAISALLILGIAPALYLRA